MKRITLLLLILSMLVLSCTHIDVKTPEGFAPYEGDRQYIAVSPEGMRFRVKIVENDPEQNIDFWSEAVGNHLAKEGYTSASTRESFEANGKPGVAFEWAVPYGSEDYLYMTAIIVDDDMIAVAEAAGEQKVYADYRGALAESLASIDLSRVNVRAATRPPRAPRPARRPRFRLGGAEESAEYESDESFQARGFKSERSSMAADTEAPAMVSESAPAPVASGSGTPGEGASTTPTTQSGEAPVETERKRVYSGACRIRVDDVIETKNKIASIAEKIGGYVEQVSGNTVVIRVPAEDFEVSFLEVMALGEVLDKRRETFDVTTYFRDQTVRLTLAEKARTRLYDLLERTNDVQERLKILREIGRLTEQIEDIKSTLEVLERMISFSRITVQVEPRLQSVYMDKGSIPFDWIAQLDPLYMTAWGKPKKITLTMPDGYAVFDGEDSFRAESAEGTRVRLGTVANEPQGGSAFWQQALRYHLRDFYRTAEELSIGSFEGIIFTSKDREPYIYLVAVLESEGEKDLPVFEVFFPDVQTYERRIDGIRDVLTNAEVKR